jgi:lysophospholipase L1-like esterase
MHAKPIGIVISTLLVAMGCQQAGSPVAPTPIAVAGGAAVTANASTWLAFGDSITQDAFATNVAWRSVLGTDGPQLINAGVRGDTTTTALTRLDGVLRDHPRATHVGVAFGTNDVWGRMTIEQFTMQLQQIVDRVRAAGKVPVLATIPYSPESELAKLPEYNRAIARLQASNSLPAGPDLYALIAADPTLLAPDGVHTTPQGSQAIQRAWAEVASRLLRP